MNDIERQKLKKHLRKEVDTWLDTCPQPIVDDGIWIDEDSAQNYISREEILVFRLEEYYLIPLMVAYQAYECLIDIISPPYFAGELLNLIEKARDICPSVRWNEYEKPFETGIDEAQWFTWFAKEFLDIHHRQSRAYHDKRNYNLSNITIFQDESG